MADRIRRGTLKIGDADQAAVANMQWNDAHEFDRSQADDEASGDPVEMSRGGSATLTLLAGYIPTGHAAGGASVVYTYKKVSVTAGVETVYSCAVTFTDCYFNTGGSVPAEGRGEIRCSFDYATSSEAAPVEDE
jgi:hypothetical protein